MGSSSGAFELNHDCARPSSNWKLQNKRQKQGVAVLGQKRPKY